MLGDDLILQLQNGQLNVLIPDDVAIDYASLSITILSLRGDINHDGIVSADDYVSVQVHFGKMGDPGILSDASHDGFVSADDYVTVQALFGETVPPDSVGNLSIIYEINSISEPASLSLVTLCAMLLLRHQSRFSSYVA